MPKIILHSGVLKLLVTLNWVYMSFTYSITHLQLVHLILDSHRQRDVQSHPKNQL